MTEWRVVVNDNQRTLTDTDGLFDVETTKTFNPFGDFARAWFDDLEGELFDLFTRGTKVEFQYDAPYTSGFVTDFVGFVVSDFETDAQGAEQLEVEAYSFDQFLRGTNVSSDLSGLRVFDALKQVIQDDVPPVSWDSANVDVVNNKKLTQSYQGGKVEDFLLSVSEQSSGELFGVTEGLEFFFDLPERTRTRTDIDNSEWITHNINEEGGETKNQVTVFYADGDKAVTVDDSNDQLEIQDNLGAAGPATQTETITREKITNINDAINVGEAYLNGRASTLTGSVTTTGLIDAQPGEVVGVTINSRGIDGDFRIAENKTRWTNETNELTLVAKKGADDDILIAQSETVKRVENRPTDDTVVPDKITDTDIGAVFDVSITAGGENAEITRLTNAGRNAVRDGIINETVVSNPTLQASTSDARPNRSDTSLTNVVDSVSASTSRSGETTTYTANVTGSGIRTIGVLDGSGNLIAQGRLASPVTDPTVDLSISVSNDSSISNSVLTTTGQEICAKILNGEIPSWPQSYAYGDGTADPAESDTSLTSQVTTQSLDSQAIQTAGTTNSLQDLVSINDTDPLEVSSGKLRLLQSAYKRDTASFLSNDGTLATDTNAVNELAIEFTDDGTVTWAVTTEYDMPAGGPVKPHIAIRVRSAGTSPIKVFPTFDGNAIPTIDSTPNTSYQWIINEIDEIYTGDVLDAGDHEIGVTTQASGSNTDNVYVDQVVLYDDRFNYTFDNTLNSSNQLEGLELYPDAFLKDLATAETQQPVSEASVFSSWADSDVSNNQYIEFANDGTNYKRISNSATGSVTFSSSEFDIDSRINFSRYGSRTNDTPTQGFKGQELSIWQLSVDPEAVTTDAIGALKIQTILSGTKATSQTFSEAGLVDSNGTLLTHSLIPEFVKQNMQQVVSGERITFNND